jgi:hypothetical protein
MTYGYAPDFCGKNPVQFQWPDAGAKSFKRRRGVLSQAHGFNLTSAVATGPRT